MGNEKVSDREYFLYLSLRHASDMIIKARQQELDKYNISIRRSAILSIVNDLGGEASTIEISRRIFRAPNTTSVVLSGMVKNGLLKRKVNQNGRQKVKFTITGKGEKLLSKVVKRQSLHRIFSVLTEEEQKQLTSYLLKISKKVSGELGMLGVGEREKIIRSLVVK